jgi:hypothetical protein
MKMNIYAIKSDRLSRLYAGATSQFSKTESLLINLTDSLNILIRFI